VPISPIKGATNIKNGVKNTSKGIEVSKIKT